jgi:hypothetical protein
LRRKELNSWWPASRDQAREALLSWKRDQNLAGLRDASALAKLPAEEREACRKLWADVDALLKKAGEVKGSPDK